MFTETDVAHMAMSFDLSKRDDVFAHADAIYAAVSNGSMPPPNTGETWTPEMCAKFKAWQEAGGPP